MKRVLVKCKIEEEDGAKPCITPPVGLWSIRENVKSVEVIDLNVDPESAIVADEVGFSLSFPAQENSFNRMCKKTLAGHVVIGGPYGGVSKRFSDIPALTQWAGPGENYWIRNPSFNGLKYPHFSLEEIRPYWLIDKPFGQKFADKWAPIETSRGCFHKCGYCGMPKFWGAWQPKDAHKIEPYLKWLRHDMGIDQLIILDDNVSLSKKRFLELLKLIEKYDMIFTCPNGIYARSLLDDEVMKSLNGYRARALSLPFETGSERTAELMKLEEKWLPFETAKELVLKLKAKQIHTTGFFIIGYPGETREDVQSTLDYADALPLDERYIYFATPYEGTRMYRECMAGGYIKNGQGTYKKPVIDTPQLPREVLQEMWSENRDAALSRRAG